VPPQQPEQPQQTTPKQRGRRQFGKGIAVAETPQQREARARALEQQLEEQRKQREQQLAEAARQRDQARQQKERDKEAVVAFFAEERRHYQTLKLEKEFDLLADRVQATNKQHPSQKYVWQSKLSLGIQSVQFNLHQAQFYPTAAHASAAIAQQAQTAASAEQQEPAVPEQEASEGVDLYEGLYDDDNQEHQQFSDDELGLWSA
jgi:hypothetical protein